MDYNTIYNYLDWLPLLFVIPLLFKFHTGSLKLKIRLSFIIFNLYLVLAVFGLCIGKFFGINLILSIIYFLYFYDLKKHLK
mgnify:CR=1 FL=1